MGLRFVYITASSEEEAARIGKELVTRRLAACAGRESRFFEMDPG